MPSQSFAEEGGGFRTTRQKLTALALAFLVLSLGLFALEPFMAPTFNRILSATQSPVEGSSEGSTFQASVSFTAEATIYKYGWYPIFLPSGLYMIWLAQALLFLAAVFFLLRYL